MNDIDVNYKYFKKILDIIPFLKGFPKSKIRKPPCLFNLWCIVIFSQCFHENLYNKMKNFIKKV